MKCIKCQTENINNANYCQKCKYHFSEEEQKIAKRKTIPGKLEQLEKLYDTCTLKIITDHIIFKIISLLIVISFAITFSLNYGNSLKILESDLYQIQYNTKTKEYYLLIKKAETILSLYIPNQINKLTIKHIDQNNQQIKEIEYHENKKIVLSANEENDYYIVESQYKKGEKTTMKINIYQVGE